MPAVRIPLAEERAVYGDWPRSRSRALKSGVGYVRIATMRDDEAYLSDVRDAIEGFRGAPGLIIDVRGNSGGARDVTRIVPPYLMPRDSNARVINVAVCRIGEDDDPARAEGYLDNRLLYPATSPYWNESERAAIAAFEPGFHPEWQPPAGEFSAWHFHVVSRERWGPDVEPLEIPVVVLMDDGCFSATDVFLGAVRGLPDVILMGTASSGSSGRGQDYRLESGLDVRLSSMVSFRPDGHLCDTRGVEPDVAAEPVATDFTVLSDSVLARAERWVLKKK